MKTECVLSFFPTEKSKIEFLWEKIMKEGMNSVCMSSFFPIKCKKLIFYGKNRESAYKTDKLEG